MIDKLETLWCKLMHDEPMWPMYGHYECRTCGREYPVEWAQPERMQPVPATVTWKLARASK